MGPGPGVARGVTPSCAGAARHPRSAARSRRQRDRGAVRPCRTFRRAWGLWCGLYALLGDRGGRRGELVELRLERMGASLPEARSLRSSVWVTIACGALVAKCYRSAPRYNANNSRSDKIRSLFLPRK